MDKQQWGAESRKSTCNDTRKTKMYDVATTDSRNGFVPASLANLGLETTLDGVDGTTRATGFTSGEKDAVFFGEDGVG